MTGRVAIGGDAGPMDVHPLVDQLWFTRREFLRGIKGVTADDAAVRLGPMNCIAWKQYVPGLVADLLQSRSERSGPP